MLNIALRNLICAYFVARPSVSKPIMECKMQFRLHKVICGILTLHKQSSTKHLVKHKVNVSNKLRKFKQLTRMRVEVFILTMLN